MRARWRPPTRSMLGDLSAQDITSMLDYRIQCIESIPHSTWRTGQVDDQRFAAHARDSATQRRAREIRQRQHTNALGDSLGLPIYHRSRRFRRDIARRQARPPSGEHEVRPIAIACLNEHANNLDRVVSAAESGDQLVLLRLHPTHNYRTRDILAVAPID